ncbi:MAG TPA: hypothetical protein PLE33_07905 [Candidatus Cloacimonas sp.]|nr:hypothetical protein [Candidatus Cloacimonas sp.]
MLPIIYSSETQDSAYVQNNHFLAGEGIKTLPASGKRINYETT